MTSNKYFQSSDPTGALWARFRFSVVGALLSAPRARGDLVETLQALAAKTWTHPITGREVRFAFATVERWYYRARRERDDPVKVLRRTPRKDRGRVSLPPAMAARLAEQYVTHPHWSYQLHYDNLAAQARTDSSLGTLRPYCTVRRYMQAHGLVRKRRERPKATSGERRAAQRREQREIRSYEAEYAGPLWHLGFHHGSLQVLTPSGQWRRPIVLGILDDYSRLCCHLQWYLSETAEMLSGHPNLTLDFLNEATQAWVEVAYHKTVHRETGKTPVERFAQSNDVLRASPTSHELRAAFRLEVKRRQRQSDGTISLAGVRFEVPARFRHFRDLWVRYARWDLGQVDLVDPQTGIVLAAIYPLDRTANADGRRASIDPDAGNPAVAKEPPRSYELPPLLKQILAEFSATGRPPAYLPKPPEVSSQDRSQTPEKDQDKNS